MNPHDACIKTLVKNGWLGGVAFLAVIAAVLLRGFPTATRDWPFRDSAMVILASLIGTAAGSVIIDMLRWRHFFVSPGMMSGLTILMRHHGQPWRLSSQRLPGRVDHFPSAEIAR
jgi:MFS family permease